MSFTCHSDIGKIKLMFIKHVQRAFISNEHIEEYWAALNYLGKPNLEEAITEYAHFQSVLKNNGAEILDFHEDQLANMDSVYCRDASIATNQGMIICNMGKPGRANEPSGQQK